MLDIDSCVTWAIAHPFLTLAIVVVVARACFLVGGPRRRRQRARAAAAEARLELAGFVPHPNDPRTVAQIDAALDALPLFPCEDEASRAGERTTRDVFRRPLVGGEDLLFVLCRTDPAVLPDEDGPSVIHYRVAAFRRSGRALPFFNVEPRAGRSRPASILDSASAIDVSDVPGFSMRYVASGSSIAAVSAILADGLAARLADTSGWIVAGINEWLIVARRLSVPEDDVVQFLDEAERIAEAC